MDMRRKDFEKFIPLQNCPTVRIRRKGPFIQCISVYLVVTGSGLLPAITFIVLCYKYYFVYYVD